MVASRRRRVDAALLFQGKPVTHSLLPELWQRGETERFQRTRYRMAVARGLRLMTMTIQLRPTWIRRHPDAASWVVKVLPERRTLERDLVATIADVEPVYDRAAIGDLEGDNDDAKACANFMNTWRERTVPFQAFAEKGVEDGPFGVAVVPSDADYGGMPDLYDRLDDATHAEMDDERRATYEHDASNPRRPYVGRNADGSRRYNPRFDRDKSGKPRPAGAKDFTRDDAKSQEAYDQAQQRYLLRQEQGGVAVRLIPAADCIPFLARGIGRERWRVMALLERTLYAPEQLIAQGYGWKGMGDSALIPQGYEPERATGQNGMLYLYTLYMVWVDPEEVKRTGRRIERPIIVYSVAGGPTWTDDQTAEDDLPENGVAVIDLYETLGLTGPFWWFGGGLHTSDDNPDFYWEPYLWPLAKTILGIEGLQTMAAAATAVNATPGYWHKPDAALVALDGGDLDSLVETDGTLQAPKIPESGEVETAIGDVVPAMPATVSPDLWRMIQVEMASLRANTALEQPGGVGAQPSGHAMVVRETIAQTAKRHVREAARDAVKFAGERAMRIFAAIATEHNVRWPIQTTQERPVGSETRASTKVLEFDAGWVGDGEYNLVTDYPAEQNPVRVQQEMAKIQAGVGSLEELAEASGITDVETWWSKVVKTQVRMSPEYRQALVARLAKRQGNKLMLQVIALQKQQRMTQQGVPGFEQGVPTAALNRPGETQGGGGMLGGPTTAQRSLGGQVAAQTGPALQDAHAQMLLGQGQRGAA